MASDSKESPSNNPGLHTTPDEATKGYIMQQTVRYTLETLAHKFIMYNNLYPLLFLDLWQNIFSWLLAGLWFFVELRPWLPMQYTDFKTIFLQINI